MPTRGSRFVGLLSMIITSVLGSGLEEQERREMLMRAMSPIWTSAGRIATRLLRRASRIRNFPQDRWALGTGCGGNVRRPAVPGLVGQEREGGCLFGCRGQSEFVG